MSARTAALLILVAMLALGSVFAGAGYLQWLLPGGLPLGNALAAIGLSAAAGAGYVLSKPKTVLRWVAVPSLLLALAWLPISIGLAGNLSLNFDDVTGPAWIRLSGVTFALAAICLLWAVMRMLVKWLARPGSGSAG